MGDPFGSGYPLELPHYSMPYPLASTSFATQGVEPQYTREAKAQRVR